jgi:hypothetical protein
MNTSYDKFLAHYAQLSSDDLMHLAVTAPELVEDAQRALRDELLRRGIKDTSAYRAELDTRAAADGAYLEERRRRVDKAHWFRVRLASGVLGVVFLLGAWRAFVGGDGTNGIGMMIACSIALPTAVALSYVRRMFLRFALRK